MRRIKVKKLILTMILSTVMIFVVACGDNVNNDKGAANNNVVENNNNDDTENNSSEPTRYQVGETGKITSRGYDFEYEATVNEYEITDKSDKYDMNDFYMNYEENNYDDSYIVISNVTIHNTSDENFTPSQHIPMHVSEAGNEAGEDVIYDYFPEFDENVAPGESITGDLITHAEITPEDDIEGYWLKFETITENETIWELPNTIN